MSTTLRSFIDRQGITAEVEWADSNPNMPDAMEGSSHWLVTLSNERGSIAVPFTQGPAVCKKPTAEDVLDCMASDFSLIEEHSDPVKMAIELGYEIETTADVDKAKATYAVIQKHRAGLEHMLGHDAMQALLYEVER